ncbi:MAG: hypothetical protein U0R19_00140 [Bryobacteraceae bacterium]
MSPFALALLAAAALPAADIGIIGAEKLSGPALHGLHKLTASLQSKGHKLVTAANPTHRIQLTCDHPPQSPESFTIQLTPHLTICAADSRGYMYALLDIANNISASDPFRNIKPISESPYLAERGISIYTMHRAYFESRLHDPNYWKRYFDLLAASRINTFTIIFGYENGGFMAPLYPYFFNLEAFPQVRLIGITPQQQQKNTAALNTLIQLAHERGIDVIPAVWDHIYRGGVQGGGIAGANSTLGKDTPGLVSGVTSENLTAYTKAALQQFVKTFPSIDGIEFRMHAESGLKPEEMQSFWHDVFGIMARAKPGLRITLRAKELPDSIINDALQQGLQARVETKYWMEQMGLPFHPTHINRENQHERRHGYADLLTYPQRYRVHWRLWNGGTTRLLLWADPEYVRRFAASARLYNGNSFDVNEMLATKMLGEPHDKAPFFIHTPAYRFYDYEFERYWHFYQLWGRLSYNPDTPEETWRQEFQHRFGNAGPHLMRGLHTASAILPRIVAASYRYKLFPTTRGWAEMMTQGSLAELAAAEATDTEQFQNPREAATGQPTSKRTPAETSAWFRDTAIAVLHHAAQAEKAGAKSKEAKTILTDLRILAALAQFHSARLLVAEAEAVEAWRNIVKAAGDVYSPDLAFGVHRVGFPRHWKEELTKLEATPSHQTSMKIQPINSPPTLTIQSPANARLNQPVTITAKPSAPVTKLRLRYRHLTQFEDYETLDMQPAANGVYTAQIPAAFLNPKYDLIFFIELYSPTGNRNYPDLDKQAPYIIIPLERTNP